MLEVKEIYKRYKRAEILKGAGFVAEPGMCVGIAGGNGCGKTTLLSILAGVSRPEKGSVCFNGAQVLGKREFFAQQVAYVPQENPIIPELSARDNFRLWYKGSRTDMEADLESGMAKRLGLPEFLNTAAGKLSGGQKKRLSIASALSSRAAVLILDEPGAALDLEAKEAIVSCLQEAVRDGKIVILTSHEMGELSICSRLYVLKDGVLKAEPLGLTSEQLIARF